MRKHCHANTRLFYGKNTRRCPKSKFLLYPLHDPLLIAISRHAKTPVILWNYRLFDKFQPPPENTTVMEYHRLRIENLSRLAKEQVIFCRKSGWRDRHGYTIGFCPNNLIFPDSLGM